MQFRAEGGQLQEHGKPSRWSIDGERAMISGAVLQQTETKNPSGVAGSNSARVAKD
jgi:hypothetical protein